VSPMITANWFDTFRDGARLSVTRDDDWWRIKELDRNAVEAWTMIEAIEDMEPGGIVERAVREAPTPREATGSILATIYLVGFLTGYMARDDQL